MVMLRILFFSFVGVCIGKLASNGIITVPSSNLKSDQLTSSQSSISRLSGGFSPEISSYDYIIVGGGSAGCLLANRLSQDPTKHVLMIEAGSSDFNNKLIKIPAGLLKVFKSNFDWDFASEPYPEIQNREVYICRGKVLGGSSCANVLLYHRGDKHDYDDWVKATHSKEWSADEILPYFKKHEKFYKGEGKFHGGHGEASITMPPYQNKLSSVFLDACCELGLVPNDDFNAWSRPQTGYGRFHVALRNGNRESAATAFLKPVLGRKNLKVISNTLARKILFDGDVAIGVEYEDKRYGVVQSFVRSPGEVILSCGAIHTPQLLMLSGIGPKDELEMLNIPCLVDSPGVGKNLQDHPAVVTSFKCAPGNDGVSATSHFRIRGTMITNPIAIFQWLFLGKGVLTTSSCDHGLFAKTSPELSSPDLQMRFVPAKALSSDGMGTLVKLSQMSVIDEGFSFQSIAARPLSRGQVKLASADPSVKPIVNIGYITDKEGKDIRTLREGIKLARQIAKMEAFKKYYGEEVYPGDHVQSDEDLDEYIRSSIHSSNAVVGTCKMGTDKLSVVDAELKVHGVRGLRIVDASVMPKIIGGQTVAPVYMIAEKAYEFITSQSKPSPTPVEAVAAADSMEHESTDKSHQPAEDNH